MEFSELFGLKFGETAVQEFVEQAGPALECYFHENLVYFVEKHTCTEVVLG